MASPSSQHLALSTALKPRGARDGRRVALLEEGGGIRGAFGAGVQAGFAEAGLPFDAFDVLYGTSAGALNLMYWASRRPRIGTRVYIDELVRPDQSSFFLYRTQWDLVSRLARGLPVLDVAAVGRAMTDARPIDPDAIRAHPAPIRVPVTRSADLGCVMLDVRALAPHDLMPKLLAAASVPVLADPMLNGASGLFDGAFVTPLPVREVLSDGYTDLVVILTLPRWSGPPFWEELVLGALARRRGVRRELVRAAGGGRRARRESLRVLRKPPPGVNVTVIAPEVRLTKSLDQRPEWIERSVEAGVQAGRLAVELARCART